MRAPHPKALLAPLLLLLAVTAAFAIQKGRPVPPASPEPRVDPDLRARLQRFEARLEEIRREQHVQGLSAAVVKGQEVVYLKGLGTAADGGPATPDTAYAVPSLNRLPGQTWTVRHLAQLDALLARGATPENRPYLAWRSERPGGTPILVSEVQEKDASLLYLKAPEKRLALILLAQGPIGKGPVFQAFLKTFLE
jgi:hypothetical protein